MEFNFNITDIFQHPIIEINRDLIPPGFRGDRRMLWNTVNKVTEIVNALGEASAAAQGLSKPVTTSERLKNSEHKVYLLVDQQANGGKGAINGMLRIGAKGLYIFDKEGQHYQVSPPCILDFYIHESSQRRGLGKLLFQHMLQKEQVDPGKMAIDRPNEKLIRFLNKHYGLESPVKQMNNYVVFERFFPKKEAQSFTPDTSVKRIGLGKKESANGLQSHASPFGRFVPSRPLTCVGKLLHSDLTDNAKNIASMPILNQNKPGINIRESQSTPYYSDQATNNNQQQESTRTQQEYSNIATGYSNPASTQEGSQIPNQNMNIQNQYNQHLATHNQNVNFKNQYNQNPNLNQMQLPAKSNNSLPEFQTRNQAIYHQQQHPQIRGIQSSQQFGTVQQVNPESNINYTSPQAPTSQTNPMGQQYIQDPLQNTQQMQNQSQLTHTQSQHLRMNPDSRPYQEGLLPMNSNQTCGASANTQHQTPQVMDHQQNPAHLAQAPQSYQTEYYAQNQQAEMCSGGTSQHQQPRLSNNNLMNAGNLESQQSHQQALQQSAGFQGGSSGDHEEQKVANIPEGRLYNDQDSSPNQMATVRTHSQTEYTNQQPIQENQEVIQYSQSDGQPLRGEQIPEASNVLQGQGQGNVDQTSAVNIERTKDLMPQESRVAYINPLDSKNMSNPNYISQVQYNPLQKTPVASRTTVPMKEGVLEYGYPPQLSREQVSHFQKPNTMGIH